MNGRGDDDADAERAEADDDAERDIFVFDQFLPEVVRREFVHDEKCEAEHDDADEGVEDGGCDGLDVHGLFVAETGAVAAAEPAAGIDAVDEAPSARICEHEAERGEDAEGGIYRVLFHSLSSLEA